MSGQVLWHVFHFTSASSLLGTSWRRRLESEAAFKDRAEQIGVEERYIQKFVSKSFAAFGLYAFCVVYPPHHADETPLERVFNWPFGGRT